MCKATRPRLVDVADIPNTSKTKTKTERQLKWKEKSEKGGSRGWKMSCRDGVAAGRSGGAVGAWEIE